MERIDMEGYAWTETIGTDLFELVELDLSPKSLEIVERIDVVESVAMVGLCQWSGFRALVTIGIEINNK